MILFKAAQERFLALPFKIRTLLFFSAAAAVIWTLGTLIFISKESVEILSTYQMDKVIHFAGGFVAASFVYSFLGITRFSWLFVSLLVIGIIWEIFELIFLPDQLVRYQREFVLWSSDSFIDLVADVLGAYLFYETLFVGEK